MSGYEEAQAALAAGAEPKATRLLPPMVFMCGCRTGDNPSPSQISTDDEGFVICATHRMRRYGWRSLPEKGSVGGAEFELAGFSELERERYLIFGEKLPTRTVSLA